MAIVERKKELNNKHDKENAGKSTLVFAYIEMGCLEKGCDTVSYYCNSIIQVC
ncbi:MAG: hypothetical protein HZB41_02205 [Ignavibacteriae bacterium]|nr:hypothetical protein [Ignavibacteriota bacterium]